MRCYCKARFESSDRCRSRFGRRRPFIASYAVLILVAIVLLGLSTFDSIALVFRQLSLFTTLVLLDTIMISVEIPLLAFTMETFRKRDRERVINGVSLFGGIGNIIGISLVAYLSKKVALMLSLGIAFVCFICNILSRKEVPLPKLKDPPLLEPLGK